MKFSPCIQIPRSKYFWTLVTLYLLTVLENTDQSMALIASLMDCGLGARVWREVKPNNVVYIPLGTYTTVFQPEVLVIVHCASELMASDLKGNRIIIYTNS